MITDPAAIRVLYSNRENRLPPGRTLSLRPLLGARSILLQEGSEHLQRRQLMSPPLHGKRIRDYEELVAEIVEREIDRCPLDQPFAAHPHMQRATLEVILRAVFGVTDPGRLERLRRLLPQLLDSTSSMSLQLRVLVARGARQESPVRTLRVRRQQIDRELFAEISERRRDPSLAARQDILSLLILARFDDGGAMDDRELRDQLMTLLVAGHETTATALAWTIDLLTQNPAALSRLTAEVDDGEGKGEEYLRAVIQESLRLRPVVSLAGRRLASELVADGLVLAAGTDVTPAIWLTHTRPDLYPEPLAFQPERFLGQQPPTYGWLPFGGGVRRCLGAAFAEMEMRVVLRSLLRSRTLHPVGDHAEHATRRNVILSPRYGTRIILSARSRPSRDPVTHA